MCPVTSGRFTLASLLHAYRWFRERGFIPEPVPETVLAELWGLELVDEVLDALGRVPED